MKSTNINKEQNLQRSMKMNNYVSYIVYTNISTDNFESVRVFV